MKIYYKRIIFIILVLLLMTSSILSVLHLRTFKTREFIALGKQLTNQTTTIFELWISDQIRLAKQIAQNEKIVKLCLNPTNTEIRQNASAYLNTLQKLYPYYENLPIAIRTKEPISVHTGKETITVNNGEFLIDTSNNSIIGKGGEDYSYISQVFNGKEYYVSEIYRSITGGNPIFVISAPVKHNGEIVGVSIVSPKMSYLTELFVDSITLGNTGYMFVVDDAYATIAHKNRDFILSGAEKNKKIVKYITSKIDQGKSFFEADLYQANKYYYGEKINLPANKIQNNLYIVITQEKMEVFEKVHIYAFFSIIIVLIIAVLTYKVLMLVNANHLHDTKERQLTELNKELEIKVSKRTALLEEMAKRDSMTGLYNHEYIISYLSNLIPSCNESKNLSVAIIDIDDFKNVNDIFGHQTGDIVIKTIADILTTNVNATDRVGRYGGEEFLIIFNNMKYTETITIVERIRKTVQRKKFTDIKYSVTISIGLAKYKYENAESLIKRADQLMYTAKSNGKNQVVHDLI